MKKSRLLGAVCAFVFGFISISSNAALIGVLPLTPGGTDYQAYYDDMADLSWLANANAAGTEMIWADAMTWATGLNINGVTGWRLPDTNPHNGTTADDILFVYDGSKYRGFNVSAPDTLYAGSKTVEMAYLFYNTLGNKGYCDPVLSTASTCSGQQSGWGLSNTGPFRNIQPSRSYWSSTRYNATVFSFNFSDNPSNGSVNLTNTHSNNFNYAWAVHDGNVGAVPIPAALWLFGSGLLGLIGLAKKKAA